MTENSFERHRAVSRRGALKLAGATAAGTALGAPAVWAASGKTIKIGFVSPQSGPLAVFAESDKFTIGQVNKALAGGVKVAGATYDVEIIYKDSQSNSNRASDVTSDLILNDGVDIVVAASTPDTTVPVADMCELNGVPCVTNDTPWQPYFFGRHGDPKKGFQWTYHYFWGLEDLVGVYTSIWSQVATSKVVGGLWPNDTDGNVFSSPKVGFPPVLSAKDFKLVDLGRFPLPENDFATFIEGFKNNNVEIVTGVMPAPDFANFWNEAGQQGFRPKIVTCAKATEFPSAVQGFGDRADGLSVEIWWSPTFPFSSSLTGATAAELGAAYTAETGRPWTMPVGFRHSLFEVAVDALKRANSTSASDIRDAIVATNLNTMVGPLNFTKGPVPNIAKTPLAGGQWRKGANGLELVVVDNSQAPEIAVHSSLQLLS